MELIFDIIIRNVPNVVMSREQLLERLVDRAAEEKLSEVMLCYVVAGEKGEPGRAFFSLKDLSDNSQALAWDGMDFYKHRLEFSINRRCVVSWARVECELAGELRKRDAEDKVSSEPKASKNELTKDDSWDDAKWDEAAGLKEKEGGM